MGTEEDLSGIRQPGWAHHLSLEVGTSGAFFFAVRPKMVHKQSIIRTFKTSFETDISNARRQGFAREGEVRQSYYAKLPVESTPICLGTLSGVFCVYFFGAALSVFAFFLKSICSVARAVFLLLVAVYWEKRFPFRYAFTVQTSSTLPLMG